MRAKWLKWDAETWVWASLMGFALSLRLGLALAFPNLLWPDEVFQTLEQGHRLAFGYGVVPWEFELGIRSWLLPGIFAAIMRLSESWGEGSRGYLLGVRAALCLLSLLPIGVAFAIARRDRSLRFAAIAVWVSAVWIDLVYFAPKAFSEVVAAHLLPLALYLAFYARIPRFFLSGCCLGAILALRIHLLPAIALVGGLAAWQRPRRNGLPVLLGMLAVFIPVGLLDALTWDYPFQSFWLNIWVNVFEGKSREWGVSPWYEYLVMLYEHWSVFLVPALYLAWRGAKKHPLLGLTAAVIIATHSAIAHKEYRFIYPAIPLLAILMGWGAAEAIEQFIPKVKREPLKVLAPIWAAMLAIAIGLGMSYRWNSNRGELKSLQLVSTRSDVCGVALSRVHLVFSGGYTYLHHDVPLFELESQEAIALERQRFNYLVINPKGPEPDAIADYRQQACFGSICTYRREGTCRP